MQVGSTSVRGQMVGGKWATGESSGKGILGGNLHRLI